MDESTDSTDPDGATSSPTGRTLWHGRFAGGPAQALMAYTVSLPFDRIMWRDDIAGSRAHVRGLARVGLLSADESENILAALEGVADEMERDVFVFVESDEDIHTAVERRVTELAGPAGGKLHTARSRNDQVALDLRLFVRHAIDELASQRAYEFALVVEPLKLVGATGSTVAPIALR